MNKPNPQVTLFESLESWLITPRVSSSSDLIPVPVSMTDIFMKSFFSSLEEIFMNPESVCLIELSDV